MFYKIKSKNKHPRNVPMIVEDAEDGKILIHTNRRNAPITFTVDKDVINSVKSFLNAKQPSLDLLMHVLSEFKEEQKDVISLFEEVTSK